MSDGPYSDDFYRALGATAESSARAIVPCLRELLPIRSAADIGCGDGGWLCVLRASGTADVLGIDGPWVDRSLLKIPGASFRSVDLEAPIVPPRRFDLAISLEVAEHLAPSRAGSFVASLVAFAPVVLFSAAIPGQGGVNHVNEQWPGYWAEHFARHGYRAMDVFRPRFWNDTAVAWWYRQNLLLFASADALAAHPPLAAAASAAAAGPLPLVHPECFAAAVRRGRPSLRRWLRAMPGTLRRSARGLGRTNGAP